MDKSPKVRELIDCEFRSSNNGTEVLRNGQVIYVSSAYTVKSLERLRATVLRALRVVSARPVVALADAFMGDTRWLTEGRAYILYQLQGGDLVFKSDCTSNHLLPWKELLKWFKIDPWMRYIASVPIPEWVTYNNLLMVHDIISAKNKPQQPGTFTTVTVEGTPYHPRNAALQLPCCVFVFESTNQLEWCLVAVKEL